MLQVDVVIIASLLIGNLGPCQLTHPTDFIAELTLPQRQPALMIQLPRKSPRMQAHWHIFNATDEVIR